MRVIVPIILTTMLLIGAGTAHACECERRNSFEQEVVVSKAIFVGEVVAIVTEGANTRITFRADRVYKGPKVDISVDTRTGATASCGYPFKLFESYLVYAYSDGTRLRTTNCSRTIPAGFARDDLEKLEDRGWSVPVNGLRARLSVLSAESAGDPFFRIYIEIQNVDNLMGQKKIRFHTDRLEIRVADIYGKELATTDRPYSGFAPEWATTMLPTEGTIKFRITFPGAGFKPDGSTLIDLGPRRIWIIPADGHFNLSGKLVIPRVDGDHPLMDWSGTLELPKVRIPASAAALSNRSVN